MTRHSKEETRKEASRLPSLDKRRLLGRNDFLSPIPEDRSASPRRKPSIVLTAEFMKTMQQYLRTPTDHSAHQPSEILRTAVSSSQGAPSPHGKQAIPAGLRKVMARYNSKPLAQRNSSAGSAA